jgi:hypothetical protein
MLTNCLLRLYSKVIPIILFFLFQFKMNASAQDPCAKLKETIAALEKQRDTLQQHIRLGTSGCGGSFKIVCERQLQGLSQEITADIQQLDSGKCTVPPHKLTLTDISPDYGNASGGNSSAGLIKNLAGDKNGLYAVSLNAGVWKTQVDDQGNFARWTQLSASPRYATSIAVDPQFPTHIVVGERDGDAIKFSDNHCGVWESFDSGSTFPEQFYFDPSPTCATIGQSHAVPGIVITGKSTTLIATPCGISRKPYFGQFQFEEGGSFTAIACFQDWIVARSENAIFLSNDDGLHWNQTAIQTSFANQSFLLDRISREGPFSVAILKSGADVFVYLPARPVFPDSTHASLLIFNVSTGTWIYQQTKTGMGTGLGGCLSVRSYYLDVNTLDDKIGGRSQLIFNCAQDIQLASKINPDGTADWKALASSGESTQHEGHFHSDIWDFLFDPQGWYAWVANDGGVYKHALGKSDKDRISGMNTGQTWENLSAGLHTHTIHTLVGAGIDPLVHLDYCTTDNDAWKIDFNSSFPNLNQWDCVNLFGDANYSYMDAANMNLAVNVRKFYNPASPCTEASGISGFGLGVSGAHTGCTNISLNIAVDAQRGFQLIQTLAGETAPPLLDAVMLVVLPVIDKNKNPVKGLLGGSGIPGDFALVRNSSFAENPDMSSGSAKGWSIVFDDLPGNTVAFWVSGGHTDPTYFILSGVTGGLALQKRRASDPHWNPMPSPLAITNPGQFGPVFVDPYDTNDIYAVTAMGIYHFNFILGQFVIDQTLTNLVSDNYKFNIGDPFTGGNDTNVITATHAASMCPMSSMSFNQNSPREIVASSPFTGVFTKFGTGDWQDISGLLPKPFTPVSSVWITNNSTIYVATEGRGLFMIQ